MSRILVFFVLFLASAILRIYAIPTLARILGGQNANIGQFPYQVSLQREDGSHICGGSILNKNYILTAAHCVVVADGTIAYPAKFFQVRVGSIQQQMGGKVVKLKRIISNQSYGNFKNDIALLELENPLKWSDYVQPIDMATEEIPSSSDVIISGWGIYRSSLLPNRLQWITLKSLTTKECAQAVSIANESLICLAHTVGKGACVGDSGGPAAYNGKLFGVASFTSGGCGSKYPDGYAKVSYYRKWVLENMTL